MKLSEHLVLAFSLACMGATLDADAASPSTTPQPPQSIPASSVPTAAAGPDASAAQAREDSKNAVEAIKTISAAAIKSAEADVELVKWIFTAMASLAALLSFLGFKTFNESHELVQKKAEDESQNLSALGSSIGQMMMTQHFIVAQHPSLTSLAYKIREMQPSDQGYSEKSSNLDNMAKQIIDLNQMREQDKASNRMAPNREPRRWAAWIDGWHGVTLHLVGRGKEAIPYLERAIHLSSGRDQSAKSRRVSHLYT